MAGIRAGSRKYEIHVERFADPVRIPRNDRPRQLQHYAQAYADSLAKLCVLAPLQWFNFYDFWATAPQQVEEEREQ
jgi:predicted LPLAT superfamily acyltransferase